MINRNSTISQIINTQKVSKINTDYRGGCAYWLYNKVFEERKKAIKIFNFLNVEENIELIYATLDAWNMNNRGAKMMDLNEVKKIFKQKDVLKTLLELEELLKLKDINYKDLKEILKKFYDKFHIMKSKARLVSNSKVLHFLFPHHFMPIDRKYTLTFYYGNTNISGDGFNKFWEITFNTAELIKKHKVNWQNKIDNKWNKTLPKLVDNAIIVFTNSKKSKTK